MINKTDRIIEQKAINEIRKTKTLKYFCKQYKHSKLIAHQLFKYRDNDSFYQLFDIDIRKDEKVINLLLHNYDITLNTIWDYIPKSIKNHNFYISSLKLQPKIYYLLTDIQQHDLDYLSAILSSRDAKLIQNVQINNKNTYHFSKENLQRCLDSIYFFAAVLNEHIKMDIELEDLYPFINTPLIFNYVSVDTLKQIPMSVYKKLFITNFKKIPFLTFSIYEIVKEDNLFEWIKKEPNIYNYLPKQFKKNKQLTNIYIYTISILQKKPS